MTRIFFAVIPIAISLLSSLDVAAAATSTAARSSRSLTDPHYAFGNIEDTTGTVWDVRPF